MDTKDGLSNYKADAVVAILAHDMFEDWLEGVGLSLDEYWTEATGSWWFNYIQALHGEQVRAVLICTSSRVTAPSRFTHKPTGATVWVLPAPRTCRFLRRLMLRRLDRATIGMDWVWNWIVRAQRATIRHLASYVSTPLAQLASVLREESASCLLVEEYEYPRFDLAVLLGWRLGMPVFGTYCGARPQGFWRRPLRFLAMKMSAGFVIGATSEAKRLTARYGVPSEKIALLFNALDFSIWCPSEKEDVRAGLGIPEDARVAMFHGGTFVHYKGLDVLLDAWEKVCAVRPNLDLRLILIGTGPDAGRFSQMIASRQIQGVTWINRWIHDQQIIQHHLSAADIFVFPSRGDACPVAVLEAMACGLPVVAAGVNGIPDLIPRGEESGGILVPPGDVDALAREVGRILDAPSLTRELGQSARHHAEMNFSEEALGRRLRAFLLSEPAPVSVESDLPVAV